MPRKLPTAYVRKLNEEQKLTRANSTKRTTSERMKPKSPESGRLKGFKAICQTCGANAQFTVDKFGYAKCNNCHAIANYRLGQPA